MKPVLLLIYRDAHFTELLRAARAMRATGRFDPQMIFLFPYAAIVRDLTLARNEGFLCLGPDGTETRTPTLSIKRSGRPLASLKRALRIFLGEKLTNRLGRVRLFFFRESVLSYGHWRAHFRQSLSSHSEILRRQKTRLLVLAEDNPSYNTDIWIHAAKQEGVRSVILPFTVSGPDEFAEGFFRAFAHQASGLFGSWIARRYPRWAHRHRDRLLLRLPPGEILAREAEGLTPPLPWVLNSGNADAIAVESSAMLEHYRRQGLPPPQLEVTGALYDDQLTAVMKDQEKSKKDLCLRYGLNPSLPLFVCALPPNQFILSGPQTEFSSYQHLISSWVEAFREVPNTEVIFKIHPRHNEADFAFLKKGTACFAKEDTATLIPAADFYVASVSATIRWALAAGKPVVNYDSYRLRYKDYECSAATLRTESLPEFKALLKKIALEKGFVAPIKQAAKEESAAWGQFDGNSTQRIIALFDRLTTE